MTHKVLVLCQRRKSNFEDLQSVTDDISSLVTRLLGDDTDIKYLTDIPANSPATADFRGEFGDNDWTKQTLEENSYSLIIANTCPFLFMPWSVVHRYLNDKGLLALTNFQKNLPPANSMLEMANHLSKSTNFNFHYLFHIIPNVVIFEKRSRIAEGGTINSKYSKYRKPSKSRKTSKSKKYSKSNS
jgi:hypothetical protein